MKIANFIRNGAAAAVATAVVTLSAPASAALVFFGEDINANGAFVPGGSSETARNAFLAGLIGVGTEDFEGVASGTAGNGLVLNFPGSVGNITATLSDNGESSVQSAPCCGRFATSGVNTLADVTNGFTLDFSTDIAAFGFYGTDIGDFNGRITLELSNGNVQNFIVPNTLNGPNASLLFWGIVGGPGEVFNKVVFGNTNAGTDFFGFDDLTVGDLQQVKPMPVPATLPLIGAALLGLAWSRKRRNRNS